MQKDFLPAWLLPEVKLASRPALLALILLLLVGLGAVLASWSTRPESADFHLLADPSSHKLDITSAQEPASSVPAISSDAGLMAQGPAVNDGPARLEIPAPDLTDSQGAYKIPDLPAETPPSPSSPAPTSFDAGNLFVESSLPGETPMIRNWKMLGYPAILTAALAAAPSLAEEGENAKQNTDTKKVTLEDINESLKSVQKKLEEYRLGANIMGEDLQSLKNKVAQLEKDVSLLRSRPSTSNYQPTPPTPSAGAGHVRLVNTWPATVTILLNNRSFRVEPGQTIEVPDVPAGSFTYEVLEARPDNTALQIKEKQPRTLAAGETFTIHVHPR